MFSYISRDAIRTTSMLYTQLSIHLGRDAHNKISDGLFIGTIPIKEVYTLTPWSHKFNDQHKKIIAFARESNPSRPLKLVVSVVKQDEFKGAGFANVKSMVSAADWKAEHVEHHLLEMEDFTATVSTKEAIETIFKIRKCIEGGGSVYVHCKAGRSRSIMMCSIYLAIFGTNPTEPKAMPLSEVIMLLKEKRTQMEFDLPKIKKAKEIITEINTQSKYQIKSKFIDAKPDILETIMQYIFDEENFLATLKDQKTKFFVINLPVLSKLISLIEDPSYYFFQKPSIDPIPKFLKLLHKDKCEKWFFELMHPTGLLAPSIEEKNQETNPKDLLIKILKEEILDYLYKALSCEKQDLLNYLNGYQNQPNIEITPAPLFKLL